MNKDAYYFPHFSNARHDRKLRRMRKELGLEGYGIYFMTLEVLREQEDFSYPLSDLDLLADDFGTSEAKMEAVVCAYDLFNIDEDKFFYSPKLIEYLQPYLERSKRARNAALKRWNGDSDANALPEQSKSNASKVKYSKVNESKGSVIAIASDVPNSSDSKTWQSAIRISNRLCESICEYDPTHRYNANRPNQSAWVKDIDKALRIDGRTEEQMGYIIDYIFRMNGKHSAFWAGNIESGKKLRSQFDKIKNQIKDEHTKTTGNRVASIRRRSDSEVSGSLW